MGLLFIQKSTDFVGIRVVYDINKPNGQKVQKLDVLCTNCPTPKYGPINATGIYKVAVPTFIARGGDGYKVIKENIKTYHISGKHTFIPISNESYFKRTNFITGILDTDALLQYLKFQDPVVQELDGRISPLRVKITPQRPQLLKTTAQRILVLV